MKLLLFALLFLQASQNGVVTGRVVTAAGVPAAGVRVYVMPVRDGAGGVEAATVLESSAETDAEGRYRLEAKPGRYYIAAGSVQSPTYFPGTSDIGTARVVVISPGVAIEEMNFSRFVPATRSLSGIAFFNTPTTVLPLGSTGVLSGVIRFPDGSPAPGVMVAAVPDSMLLGAISPTRLTRNRSGESEAIVATISSSTAGTPNPQITVTARGMSINTDAAGRYQFTTVSPGNYYIVAGFSDQPLFFPAASNAAEATTITTTATTKIDTLDIVVPKRSTNIAVRGRLSGAGNRPAYGATIRLRPSAAGNPIVLLPNKPVLDATSGDDGSFQILSVTAGIYIAEAFMPGGTVQSREIVVGDRSIEGVDFKLPVSVLSGRILSEDGSAIPASSLGLAEITSVGNPNLILRTILPIDEAGRFSRTVDAGQYRFYLTDLSDEYTIKSLTVGTVDLLKERLNVTEDLELDLEMRLAKKVTPADINVRGRIVDNDGKALTGLAVQLCCFDSGPFQRISTRLEMDGSFAFTAVPSGKYVVELKGRTLDNSAIDVLPDTATEVTLRSTSAERQPN